MARYKLLQRPSRMMARMEAVMMELLVLKARKQTKGREGHLIPLDVMLYCVWLYAYIVLW